MPKARADGGAAPSSQVAPKTVAHIFRLVTLGAYTGNHFFRVDRGFVAQTAEILGGRTMPLNAEQREEAGKRLPLEVDKDVKHTTGGCSGRHCAPMRAPGRLDSACAGRRGDLRPPAGL